MKQRTIT